jgi:ubiquitin carboxyl-terminal hydrolase 34
VFGGKTCSQIVCQSCGKVKNRLEDYYNLSLTVKDIKSVGDSLEKQVEGEIISGFKCDGCNKEVDVQKRTLITETPNVLIIHLQRIVFNFDTFQNDKLNQHFEFPALLDLKPYSYHEVMRREGLGKNKPKTAEQEEQELKDKQDGVQKADEDDKEPAEDDCYEYKLVGVNVHSGSANAGHYWSYINTVRGFEEKDGMTD